MRKLIVFMVISLDGFICGENNELDWEVHDDSVSRYLIPDLLDRVDTMLLGRVLYKGFEQVWPAMATDTSLPQDLRNFANWVTDTPKIVFSNSLDGCLWANSEQISVKDDRDIAREIRKLKQQSGKDMVVFGGAQFAQTVTRLGLVDEFQLKAQPIALGKGKALFGNLTERATLRLIASRAFDSGVVTLRYEPIPAMPAE